MNIRLDKGESVWIQSNIVPEGKTIRVTLTESGDLALETIW